MSIIIRPATEQDAKELLSIYAPYVEHTAITFEYTIPTEEEFAERIKNTSKRFPYLVAEADGKAVGYAYASAFHVRKAYEHSVESSIYVRSDERGHGIGKQLYGTLESALIAQGFLNMNACIAYTEKEDEFLTNESVDFHGSLGFTLVGRFHKCGYKFGRWYDMVWMEKHIAPHTDTPPAIREVGEAYGAVFHL